MRIFSCTAGSEPNPTPAASVMKKYRKQILQCSSHWTGEKKYVANELINRIITRCHELKLVCNESEAVVLIRMATYISTLLMNYVYTGRFKGQQHDKE